MGKLRMGGVAGAAGTVTSPNGTRLHFLIISSMFGGSGLRGGEPLFGESTVSPASPTISSGPISTLTSSVISRPASMSPFLSLSSVSVSVPAVLVIARGCFCFLLPISAASLCWGSDTACML